MKVMKKAEKALSKRGKKRSDIALKSESILQDSLLAKSGDVTDASEEDLKIRVRENQLSELKEFLRKISSSCKRWNVEVSKYAKSLAQLGQWLKRLGSTEADPESAYAQSLGKFGDMFIQSEAILEQVQSEALPRELDEWMANELTKDFKLTKSKYDKARDKYDKGVSKVVRLRAMVPIKVVPLYAAEKELVGLRKAYEEELHATLDALEAIECKKCTDVFEWIIGYIEDVKEAYERLNQLWVSVESYAEELQQWATKERIWFIDQVAQREKRLLAKKTEEAEQRRSNLLVVAQSATLRRIMNSISEEQAIYLPDVTGEEMEEKAFNALHHFLHANLEDICLRLLETDRGSIFDFTAAMGDLEKNRKETT